MKQINFTLGLVVILLFSACNQPPEKFTNEDKEVIKQEVKTQFNLLINALKNKDSETWSNFYSEDKFISAIAGVDIFDSRNKWIKTISDYFLTRESQKLDLIEVNIRPISKNLALLTSKENIEMIFKDESKVKSEHVFSMLWEKENNTWKIIHSHESWIELPSN